MNREDVWQQMRENTGTTPTGHKTFDSLGFLVVRNVIPHDLIRSEPNFESGRMDGDENWVEYDTQVPGSLERYSHPDFKDLHVACKKIIEEIVGVDLYLTYFFDRYYHTGEMLEYHADRPSCEISASVHCSTNLPEPYCDWPLYIQSVDGREHCLHLNKGDMVIYKGCERPHWRNPLTTPYQTDYEFDERYYYHQVFLHYVLQQGIRSHHRFDK